jgi:shikimate dehydrogenase
MMGFIGLNLTVPHKLEAVKLVDVLDESARTWGAVNTIRFEGKDSSDAWQPLAQLRETPTEMRSHGFNTDADAITRALREDLGMDVRGKNVILLGTGGAGRTAALRLAAEEVGALHLVNRTVDKAAALRDEIRQRFPRATVSLGYPAGAVDLVLNCTSLGLSGTDRTPVDESVFSLARARAVYDMIYRPAHTPLLVSAKAAGCQTSNGLGMLLYQGAAALELWTGQKAPLAEMRQALEANVYGTAQ